MNKLSLSGIVLTFAISFALSGNTAIAGSDWGKLSRAEHEKLRIVRAVLQELSGPGTDNSIFVTSLFNALAPLDESSKQIVYPHLVFMSSDAKLVEILIKDLQSERAAAAAELLAYFNTRKSIDFTREQKQAIIRAQESKDENVRFYAATIFITRLSEHPNFTSPRELIVPGASAVASIERLTELLRSGYCWDRMVAAYCLGAIGPSASRTIEALERASWNSVDEGNFAAATVARQTAADAISKIRPDYRLGKPILYVTELSIPAHFSSDEQIVDFEGHYLDSYKTVELIGSPEIIEQDSAF